MNHFQRQVRAYEEIHGDRRNRALHAIGIPMILYSMLLAGTYLRPAGPSGALASAATCLVLLPTLMLLTRSRSAAFWYLALMMPLLVAAELTHHQLGLASGLVCATGGFVAGWVVQLAGHAFEGKAARLVSSPINVLIGPVLVAQGLAELLRLRRRGAARRSPTRKPSTSRPA